MTVDGPGTGDGFQLFCAGETDISDASRPISDEEIAACEGAGIEYTELAVGIDGLTVATNPANADVECLDVPALYALLGPESEGIDNWSGANELATEVGSAYTSLPDADLVISGPGEESGTYDTFVEFAIADLAEERGQDEVDPGRLQLQPQRQRDRPGHRGLGHLPRLVGLRLLRGREGPDEGHRHRHRRRVRRPDARDDR